MEELNICKENYQNVEVSVVAHSIEEALKLLHQDGRWNIEDVQKIIPEVISLTEPHIVSCSIQ